MLQLSKKQVRIVHLNSCRLLRPTLNWHFKNNFLFFFCPILLVYPNRGQKFPPSPRLAPSDFEIFFENNGFFSGGKFPVRSSVILRVLALQLSKKQRRTVHLNSCRLLRPTLNWHFKLLYILKKKKKNNKMLTYYWQQLELQIEHKQHFH